LRFSNRHSVVIVLATVAVVLAGCSPDRDPATLFAPDAVNVLVIDAVLIVDQQLPVIRLSRTLPPDVRYTPEAAAESGAIVTLHTGSATFSYTELLAPGVYGPAMTGPPPVLPGQRYDVTVITSAAEVLTAHTTTPDRFSIDAWVLRTSDGATDLRNLRTFDALGNDVYTHPDNQLTYPEGLLDARYGSTSAAAFGAAGFQLALFSLDPGAGFVIDPPFFEEEDFEDLPRLGSSPALNGEDGYLRLPWFSIYYDGRYLYKAFAVDRNWFDLVRTIPQGGGGFGFGGNVGDGVDPPLFRVNGGIGLFGSASVDSVGFFITPLE
jgi:hypothetical protein